MWQDRFQYILVDEFQDICPLQYEVVRLLAKPQDNLFIVGDDDQAIYGFRGSRPEIMLNFQRITRMPCRCCWMSTTGAGAISSMWLTN